MCTLEHDWKSSGSGKINIFTGCLATPLIVSLFFSPTAASRAGQPRRVTIIPGPPRPPQQQQRRSPLPLREQLAFLPPLPPPRTPLAPKREQWRVWLSVRRHLTDLLSTLQAASYAHARTRIHSLSTDNVWHRSWKEAPVWELAGRTQDRRAPSFFISLCKDSTHQFHRLTRKTHHLQPCWRALKWYYIYTYMIFVTFQLKTVQL